MSRIGKKPIDIPTGVDVSINGSDVAVKGPKGELKQSLSPEMKITQEASQVLVARPSDSPIHRSLHGLTRSLINNMVAGVSQGYEKTLEIVGVGYKATKKGQGLEVAAGYSHLVTVEAISGIEFDVPIPTKIVIKGIDKQLVGETAARIRGIRPPEPYKGKGIKYQGEHIRRKVGKTAK
jgi:large subunit ribosomal protein L6